jgi:16S rRNA (cytidine1402-2'-O)-methyltransferase
MTGTLYLVATPIGNLGDITPRMREILSSVSLIGAEDTRRTGRLLAHLELHVPMTSYHDHNERTKWPVLIDRLETGEDVAVVSDAGTPGIADPGWHVVREAIARDIDVVPIPGPSALISALVVSGLPVHRFTFEGYLPRKSGRRLRVLEELRGEERTMIFYETPHRIAATLEVMSEVFGDRRASVSRELTKQHEETMRGTLPELVEVMKTRSRKGEFVIVLGGTDESNPDPKENEHADTNE